MGSRVPVRRHAMVAPLGALSFPRPGLPAPGTRAKTTPSQAPPASRRVGSPRGAAAWQVSSRGAAVPVADPISAQTVGVTTPRTRLDRRGPPNDTARRVPLQRHWGTARGRGAGSPALGTAKPLAGLTIRGDRARSGRWYGRMCGARRSRPMFLGLTYQFNELEVQIRICL